MLDLASLERYRENNRIEAKSAMGGLPQSIWETYSAFANTLGGVILLGVEENADRSFRTVDLPYPEELTEEFFGILRDPSKVSADILDDSCVRTENAGGDRIIVITVPKASRGIRPVYVGGSMMNGTYRRSGEGDYRCSRQEIEYMLREAGEGGDDNEILEGVKGSDLDRASIDMFRQMAERQEGEEWLGTLSDAEFLALSGITASDSGSTGITAAGMLMFGRGEQVFRCYPSLSMEYTEKTENGTFSVLASKHVPKYNLFGFFRAVSGRMRELYGEGDRSCAVLEALSNCIVNADYGSGRGIVIEAGKEFAAFSNPGSFRHGSLPDPRNASLMRMLCMAGLAEGEGNGIPEIMDAAARNGWSAPFIKEAHDPERVTLVLDFSGSNIHGEAGSRLEESVLKKSITDHLTGSIRASAGELTSVSGAEGPELIMALRELEMDGAIVREDGAGEPVFRLKE